MTMYAEYLRELLKPLGIYRTEGGVSGGEISALGRGLDGVHEVLSELEHELFLTTAESYGLTNYEKLLPLKPAYRSIGERRNALVGLLRMDGASFTLDAINATLLRLRHSRRGRGVRKALDRNRELPGTRGIPESFEQLRAAIEQIIPCHLEIEYFFVYTQWDYLEQHFATGRD